MPLYGYKCTHCTHEQDEVLSISHRNDTVICHRCERFTTRQIEAQIQRVEPTWLPEAVQHAVPQGSDVRRPTDRNEFNKYLKDNQVDMIG